MNPGSHEVKEVVQQTFGVRIVEQAEPGIKDLTAARFQAAYFPKPAHNVVRFVLNFSSPAFIIIIASFSADPDFIVIGCFT